MRGQMIPRGENRWLLRVYLGRENGKRKYVAKTVGGTTAEARRELTRMLRDVDTNTHQRKSSLTLAAFLDQWYEKKRQRLTPRALGDYQAVMRLYVVPILGHTKLHEITTQAVQRIYSGMRDRGLSATTIERCHTTLHQALEWAIQLGFLVKNPTRYTERPRRSAEERAMTVMTPAQMVLFLRATTSESLYPLWQLMLNTGIRPGEALGLKWGDFTGNTFFIHRVLTRDAHGRHFIKDRPKTNASRRCLTVPAPVMEILKSHKARQAKDALYYGPNYERNDLVFATKLGRWLDPDSIAKRFRKTITRLGLPKEIRWYDMRHSHATALLSNGVPLAWVSERLGHRDPKMTAHYYAKVLPEAHGQMAEVMAQVLDKAAAL